MTYRHLLQHTIQPEEFERLMREFQQKHLQDIWTIKGNQPRTEWAIEKLFVHEVCNLTLHEGKVVGCFVPSLPPLLT